MDCLIIGLLIIFSNGATIDSSGDILPIHGAGNYSSLSEKYLNPESVVQFMFQNLSVATSQGYVYAPVVRTGRNLNSTVRLTCSSSDVTAKLNEDFHLWPSASDSMPIMFEEGQEVAFCSVFLYSNNMNVNDKLFKLHLSEIICDGCNDYRSDMIGDNNVMLITIKIVDPNDVPPTIEIEQASYVIYEPNSSDEVITLSVIINRFGNIRGADSMVRVRTVDGEAAAGESYHAKTSLLCFEENQTVKTFEVEILHNSGHHKREPRDFTVQLYYEGLVNAVLGLTTVSVVKIFSRTGNSAFPAPPVIMSLPAINKGHIIDNLRSPSYPLVCVTSCSPIYPNYSKTKIFCDKNNVNMSYVSYSWEVGLPTLNGSVSTNSLQLLTRNTIFGRVDTMILDPMFFRPGYVVRCVVRRTDSGSSRFGVASTSEIVRISDHGLCRENVFSSTIFSPFVATLSYMDENDIRHPNRLRIQVEIPYEDGKLPIISTSPLLNLNRLTTLDLSSRKHHMCSNLILPGELNEIPAESRFLNILHLSQRATVFPDCIIENANTTLLYRHLDLERCFWRFKAYFRVEHLVDFCGGVLSNNVDTVSKNKETTIRVPLYVASVHSSGDVWTSVEHHTEMEFAFSYESLLDSSTLQLATNVDAHIHINRIKLRSDGKLVINFQTKPMFKGVFVLQHQSNKNVSSRFLFPKYLDLHFNFSLLWTETGVSEPIQSWSAVSSYSLKDYTGVYVLELIPCIYVLSERTFLNNVTSSCVTLKPKSFDIPIVYEQVNRPTPVLFSLKTYLFLTKSKSQALKVFEDNDDLLHDVNVDSKNLFVEKGDLVHGIVFWDPGQDLGPSYKLQIETVYLCADDSYDGTFADNVVYPEGCFNSHFKHRLLLLSRGFYEYDEQSDTCDLLEAKFFDEDDTNLRHTTGVDGFVFKMDGLYNIGFSYHWFIHVFYTIGPSMQSRNRRDINESDKRTKHYIHNGTIMNHLYLRPPNISNSNTGFSFSSIYGTLILIIIIVIIVMLDIYILMNKGDHSCCTVSLRNIRNSQQQSNNKTSQNTTVCYTSNSLNVIVTTDPSSTHEISPLDATEV